MGKVGETKTPKERGNFNVLLLIRGDQLTVFDNNNLNANSLLLCRGYF